MEKSIPIGDVVDGNGNGFTRGVKPRRSQTSNCVGIYQEGVGEYEGMMGIGDTKDPTGPVLAVSHTAFRNLVSFAAGQPRR